MKVIHLIRDPRAVFVARQGSNVLYSDDQIKAYCNSIIEDVKFIQELHHKYPDFSLKSFYYPLKYEYLTLYTQNTMYDMYQFIGMEPDEHVRNFAMSVGGSGDSETMKFNPSNSNKTFTAAQVAQAWRQVIGWEQVLKIQDHCDTAMELVGYKKFATQDDVLDLNIPFLEPHKIALWCAHFG